MNLLSLKWLFNSYNDPELDHIGIRRTLQGTLAVDMEDMHRPLAFEDKLASGIVGSVVLPFHVRNANTRLIQKGELQQLIYMQLQPKQQCSSNRKIYECCRVKSKKKLCCYLYVKDKRLHTFGHCWKYSSPTTFSFSKNSTVCHNPIAPLARRHAVSIRIAVAVIAPADLLQQPMKKQLLADTKSQLIENLPDNPVKNAQTTEKKLNTKSAMTPRAR